LAHEISDGARRFRGAPSERNRTVKAAAAQTRSCSRRSRAASTP